MQEIISGIVAVIGFYLLLDYLVPKDPPAWFMSDDEEDEDYD